MSPTAEGGRTAGPWAVEDPMGADIGLWIVEAGKQTYEWRCIALVCQDDPTNDEDRDPVRPITGGEQEANAAFIIRACNSYDDLVKALEEIRDAIPANQGGTQGAIRKRAVAALSSAKGEDQ